MNKAAIWIILPLIFISSLYSQSEETDLSGDEIEYVYGPYELRPAFGIYANFGLNTHSAGFRKLDGVPTCCPSEYNSGEGFGYSFGAFYNFPIADKIEISLRGYYQNLNASLLLKENIVLSGRNGNDVNGIFEHQLDAQNVVSAGLMPLLGFQATDNIILRAGLRAGYFLEKNYTYVEEITEPSFGVFKNEGARTRNRSEGEIPNASSIGLALVAGFSFDLPLNSSKTLFLSPEAFFSLGLIPISDNWSINTFYGGLGIKWAPRQAIPPKAPPLPPPDAQWPEPPKPSPILAEITAVSVDENGKESEATEIKIEEYITRKANPLLQYVFFGENSTEIHPRYERKTNMTETERASYSVNSLYGLDNIEVYYNILNIVGRRMMAYPIANLTLTGCNADLGPEANNLQLSANRAKAIKDYLVTEWGIGPERIVLKERNLPAIPSNVNDPDGIEENRRVEMESDFDKIFEPLIVTDKIVLTNPPKIRFKPEIDSDIGVKSWKIVTAQETAGELKVFGGKGAIPRIVEWNLENEREYAPKFDEDLLYRLEVIDNGNQQWNSEIQSIPVNAITNQTKTLKLLTGELKNDVEYDQYILISFGFGQSELTNEHIPIVNSAKQLLSREDELQEYTYKIDILGRTDNIGDPDINLRLSRERALAVARAIEISQNLAKGLGENDPLFDNSTPEGRFYNRNVIVNIETTIRLIEE